MRSARRRMLVVWATAFVLLLTSRIMLGQAVNATLLGTVTDTTGAVVGKAKVAITETLIGAGVFSNRVG